jgi:hypothetical protein
MRRHFNEAHIKLKLKKSNAFIEQTFEPIEWSATTFLNENLEPNLANETYKRLKQIESSVRTGTFTNQPFQK